MEKFKVEISLKNGKEISFFEEAESKKEIFDEIRAKSDWYRISTENELTYFKGQDVSTIRIFNGSRI